MPSVGVEVLSCMIDGCDWTYVRVPPPTGDQTLAGVFGVGVFHAVAMAQELQSTEAALAEHMGLHSTVELLTMIMRLQQELATLKGQDKPA